MRVLVRYEMKKFFRKWKNLALIFGFFLLIFLYANNRRNLDEAINKYKVDMHQTNIDSSKQGLNQIIFDYEEAKKSNNTTLMEKIKPIIEVQESRYNIYLEMKEYLINNNWREVLRLEIKMDQEDWDAIEQGFYSSDESDLTILGRIEKNTYLLENEIEPINEDANVSSLNFIRIFFKGMFPLAIILIFSLCTADMVSDEFDFGTGKLLFSQSVSRGKIIWSKIITGNLICLSVLIIGIGISSLILGLLYGFGNPSYPITIESLQGNFFMEIWKFDLLVLALAVLLTIAIVSISILCSVIIGSSMGSIALVTVTYIGYYIMNYNFGFMRKSAMFIPYTYSNIVEVLNGTAAKTFANSDINFQLGVSVLVMSILIANLLSVTLISKKNIHN